MKMLYPAISMDHSNPTKNKNLIGNYLIKHFSQKGIEIEIVEPLISNIKFFFGYKKLFYEYLLKKNYPLSRDLQIIKILSKQINKKVNSSDSDFVFSFGTVPIAFLETQKPIFIIADATFANLLDYYDSYTNLPEKLIVETHEMEKNALNKATKIFFASEWALNSAKEFYKIPESRMELTYLGANLDYVPTKEEVKSYIETKINQPLKLTLIGKGFYRKGIDIAIDLFKKIKKTIPEVTLSVIGTKLDQKEISSGIQNIPFINKDIPQDMATLHNILTETHFLLFPSRAEAYGHVVAEANAYGIPVIANKTGGIPSVVKNNQNGFLFDLENEEGKFLATNLIIKLFNQKNEYKQLAFNAYEIYSSKLNWDKIIENLLYTIEKELKDRKIH